tara:strand:- start:117 stop:269 length:153 start_codon:yes stop_codon:yes gene_type:complete
MVKTIQQLRQDLVESGDSHLVAMQAQLNDEQLERLRVLVLEAAKELQKKR